MWMSKPVPQVNYTCPPGLEYLTLVDQLIVKQKVERLEILTGFDTKNKYTLKNSLGQNVSSQSMELTPASHTATCHNMFDQSRRYMRLPSKVVSGLDASGAHIVHSI